MIINLIIIIKYLFGLIKFFFIFINRFEKLFINVIHLVKYFSYE